MKRSPVSTEGLFCINIRLSTLFPAMFPAQHFRWPCKGAFMAFFHKVQIILMADKSHEDEIRAAPKSSAKGAIKSGKKRSSAREINRRDVVSQSPKRIQLAIFSPSSTQITMVAENCQ